MEEALETGDGAGRDLRAFHESHGAVFGSAGGRAVVERYGRPERAHRAVREGVGVVEMPYDVIALSGTDRRAYLNNVVTAVVPDEDGRGCRALLLDPQGRIEAELAVFAAGDRLLAFAPPGVAEGIVDGWETFIQDVRIRVATDEFAVLGVHGPQATATVEGLLAGAAAPDAAFEFVRATLGDVGVSVVRTDAPAGEVGYEVVCAAADARSVAAALVGEGAAAVPFGRATWRALTLEAGTPLFDPELAGRLPNVAGARDAVDFEKGCFVGQEVVAKVENRGRPSRRLVGLALDADAGGEDGAPVPSAGATVAAGGDPVGEVTRAAASPLRGTALALAYVDFGLEDAGDVTVEVGGGPVPAAVEALPFVAGSERSGRIPRYD